MNIKKLLENLPMKVLTGKDDLEREITGCYIGDLLSFAMSKVKCGDIWLTVMGNVNAVAVAVLADASCIVLVENCTLDEIALQKAMEQDVVILMSELSSFELAKKISSLAGL